MNIYVADNQTPQNATTLEDWLGGPDFTLTVVCAGTAVTKLQDQSIAQTCVGG